MRLCMFCPVGQELERGWPGRIDGEHVTQLAAQSLQAYFSGGSSAREHAVHALDRVLLRAPVLEPPTVRLFDGTGGFRFGNAAAIHSPGAAIPRPAGRLDAAARLAAVIGADSAFGGWTGVVEWLAPALAPPKDSDFALLLGPAVETEVHDDFDWEAARALAGANTRLRPGDLLIGPALDLHENVAPGRFAVSFDRIGALHASVA